MSKVLKKTIKYVKEAKTGLLVTVDENKIPFARPIGAFANDDTNIYFFTLKETNKVKQIKTNPTVTFYIEHPEQAFDNFKSVSIIGKAFEISDKKKLDEAVEAIGVRYPIIKEKFLSEDFKNSSIYEIKTEFIKLVDYAEENREQIIHI